MTNQKKIVVTARINSYWQTNNFLFRLLPAMSIIHDLQQMQYDTDKINRKTNVDLQKIASDKGFIICDNLASGNCMFYALSEQLKSVKGIDTSDRELRKDLVQFLRDSPNSVS